MVSTFMSIKLLNLEDLMKLMVDSIFQQIDPIGDKAQHVSNTIVSIIEDRIKVNVFGVRDWFEANLFLLLFFAIIFLMIVFKLLHQLDNLMIKYEFSSGKRHFTGLVLITGIFIWLFVAVIFWACSSTNGIKLETLKYILVGCTSLAMACIIFVWFRWLCIHRYRIQTYLRQELLTEKLLHIVEGVHTKGIVHRDLKPDNIMITFEKYGDPVENTQLFVIDFGLAYIETFDKDVIDGIVPTIDASSICAIFFWMITQIVQGNNRDKNTNLAPHQQVSTKINMKIIDTVSSITHPPDAEHDTSAKRLYLYLMTTSDKAFAFPDRQWTIEQLDFGLQLIRNTLESYKNPSSVVETLDNISNDLITLSDTRISTIPSPYQLKSPLDKTASAFQFVKAKFIEKHHRNYKWTDGSCQWLDDIHNMGERKHYDTLTYYLLNKNWSIIICCMANLDETGRNVFLSIGSIVHSLYIGIPIGQYITNNINRDK
ncbi:hypothetical protein I4U23_011251 [Adineta vaga]|nr:hypothetical protein I4U23_011251 [Adineta vaga]